MFVVVRRKKLNGELALGSFTPPVVVVDGGILFPPNKCRIGELPRIPDDAVALVSFRLFLLLNTSRAGDLPRRCGDPNDENDELGCCGIFA